MQITGSLLRKCRKNQRKAQLELYRLCYPFLMRVCLRYKKNESDAAEMLNTGMLKILDNLHLYEENVPFEAWAKRIMINTLIDDYRKHRKRKELIEHTEPHELSTHEHNHAYNESALHMEAEEIRMLINTLPNERKEIFNLFALDGYAHKEIAEMLGININTSRWHVAEARKYLQSRIMNSKPAKSVKNESV